MFSIANRRWKSTLCRIYVMYSTYMSYIIIHYRAIVEFRCTKAISKYYELWVSQFLCKRYKLRIKIEEPNRSHMFEKKTDSYILCM